MSTNETQLSLLHDLPKLLKCSIGTIFTFSILFENLIIILALPHSKKCLTKQTRIFLLNVVLVDILTGLFIVPPLTVLEISTDAKAFNRFFYLYWLVVGGLIINARVLALLIVAIDRYLAICHPIRYPNLLTFSRARLCLILSWGLALAILLPQLVVFSTELAANCRNATEMTQQPNDWTYITSFALRGILVFMCVLRFILPLTGILVMDILALRVAIKSNEGFRSGILKVKEEGVQMNNDRNDSKKNKHPGLSHSLGKSTLMRIHRGNYMAAGTKELFAQLPGTHKSLNRRTAVLPNIGNGMSNYSDSNKSHGINWTTGYESIIPNVSQAPDSDRTEPEQGDDICKESQPNREFPWPQSTRSTRPTEFGFKFNKKRLKDLGSMIPFTLLLVAFFVFSIPYQFLQVIKALWFRLDLPNEVHAYLFWLSCANAFANPVVLTFWSSACRAKVLHLISCGRFRPNQPAIKRLIIASFGTANLPYGRQVHPRKPSN